LWEAATQMLEWVVKAAKGKKKKQQQQTSQHLQNDINQRLFVLLKASIDFTTQDPLIQKSFINIFGILAPIYSADTNALNAVISKLFFHLQFRAVNEKQISLNQLSQSSKDARGEALSSLIKICKANAQLLLQYLRPFVDQAEQLWKKQEIMSSELVLLYEAFVTISAEMKDADSQSQFLAYLLDSPKREWTGPLISQLCSSEPLFLKSLDIIDEPNPQQKNQLIEYREKILYILTLFHGIARRAPQQKDNNKPSFTFPMGNYIIAILPNVMALTRTLHSIQSPQIQQHIPPDRRALLYHFEDKTTAGVTATKTGSEQTIHRKVIMLKQLCYQIIAHACVLCDPSQFWFNPQLFQLLSNSVFSFLEFIDNTDLKLLMQHFMSVFIHHCPQQLWPTLLNQTLTSLYILIHDRLNVGWNRIFERANGYVFK
jgi:hypothetical protein